MLFPERLETERLHLERLCHDTVDIFEYHEVRSRHEPDIEEVTEYLPWNPHGTVKETADYLDALEKEWANGTRAEYLIRPKEGEDGAGEIAGSGGLLVDWETRDGQAGDLAPEAVLGAGVLGGAGGRGHRAGVRPIGPGPRRHPGRGRQRQLPPRRREVRRIARRRP